MNIHDYGYCGLFTFLCQFKACIFKPHVTYILMKKSWGKLDMVFGWHLS